jgi:hypothetical protein
MPYPWTFENFVNGKNYYLPAGTYYIGDVFPALKTDIYDESFNETGHKNGLYSCRDGYILVSDIAESNDHTGVYPGSDDFEYIVISGSIGIVSSTLLSTNSFAGGKIFDFPEGVNVIIDSGLYTFETDDYILHIDTILDGPEDESEIEELCSNFYNTLTTEMNTD